MQNHSKYQSLPLDEILLGFVKMAIYLVKEVEKTAFGSY